MNVKMRPYQATSACFQRNKSIIEHVNIFEMLIEIVTNRITFTSKAFALLVCLSIYNDNLCKLLCTVDDAFYNEMIDHVQEIVRILVVKLLYLLSSIPEGNEIVQNKFIQRIEDLRYNDPCSSVRQHAGKVLRKIESKLNILKVINDVTSKTSISLMPE
ncbi:hypothetical protein GJ496_009413 [Pomphorhynchus laevis]|nr:hypothetical protein GJ496_009413 [Pomphorhynchus laevis]